LRWLAAVAAAILAAVEGCILPPGLAPLSAKLMATPTRRSAWQYGRRDARRYAEPIRALTIFAQVIKDFCFIQASLFWPLRNIL